MFLHIGENSLIPKKDIVAIVDKDSLSPEGNEDILKLIKENSLGVITDEVKTFIITSENEVYSSKISSKTLLKRNH